MKDTEKRAAGRVFFADPEFRLLFRPDKAAFIDDPTAVSRALHEEIEIKYFYEGTATLLVGDRTLEVAAGDLVVINPYEPHSTIRFGEERGLYRFLMLDLDFFLDGSTGGLDLRALMIEEGLRFHSQIRADARIADMVRRLTEVYAERGEFWRFSARGILLELISLLLTEYSERLPREEKRDFRSFETVEPALRRIREGYAERITVDELAALARVSKSHFCRVFRRVTGKSAMRYLSDYRLKIADLMLVGSGESIGTIAERCGFEDHAHFCQSYRARYGISPSGRRRRHD